MNKLECVFECVDLIVNQSLVFITVVFLLCHKIARTISGGKRCAACTYFSLSVQLQYIFEYGRNTGRVNWAIFVRACAFECAPCARDKSKKREPTNRNDQVKFS